MPQRVCNKDRKNKVLSILPTSSLNPAILPHETEGTVLIYATLTGTYDEVMIYLSGYSYILCPHLLSFKLHDITMQCNSPEITVSTSHYK